MLKKSKKKKVYGVWKRYRFYKKRAFLSIFLIRADFWHPLCLIIFFTLFILFFVNFFGFFDSFANIACVRIKTFVLLIKSSIKFCLKFEIRLIFESLEKCRLFSNHILGKLWVESSQILVDFSSRNIKNHFCFSDLLFDIFW